MSVAYKPVSWNRNKLIYDAILVAGIVLYLLAYLKLGPSLSARAAAVDPPIWRMRAFGSCAFILLTIVLATGPLARLDSRFLPLLYNRRHFGVLTALVALSHAGFVLSWYYAYSPTPPLVALFTANVAIGSVPGFPFEWFGLAALIILGIMALTSHDFWLAFLGPPVWKGIHMAVYAAYVSVVLHIALGALQDARDPLLLVLVVLSLALLCTLHLLAGWPERAADSGAAEPAEGWIDFGDVGDFVEGRAIVRAARHGERIAVFRFDDRLSALSNVCAHQNGPLGEGRIVDGLVTCPWHGYQYRLEDGCSPAPYKERVATYAIRLAGARVLVETTPQPLGTRRPPLELPGVAAIPMPPGGSPREVPR